MTVLNDLIRDARTEELTESTRVRAAFDALYCMARHRNAAADVRQALAALPVSLEDTARIARLYHWVREVAPCEPLPMSPDDAASLAERVHKSVETRRAKSDRRARA
ncbi:hypothetical protein [Paraburkholderia atlantica]|uniref:hypothetical protein n=1 Tax=Paraburkholderia atlantica TaxID=2654982 RepID=UPI0003797EC1|nr:hypothetical protein [Paraburkholderia atlantica]